MLCAPSIMFWQRAGNSAVEIRANAMAWERFVGPKKKDEMTSFD